MISSRPRSILSAMFSYICCEAWQNPRRIRQVEVEIEEERPCCLTKLGQGCLPTHMRRMDWDVMGGCHKSRLQATIWALNRGGASTLPIISATIRGSMLKLIMILLGFGRSNRTDLQLRHLKETKVSLTLVIHQEASHHTVRLTKTRPLPKGVDQAGLFLNFTSLERSMRRPWMKYVKKNLEFSLTLK